MALIIFLLFLSVPLIEIGLFITIGEEIGLWPTLGAIVLTAALGTALLRHQGFQTLARARSALNENRPPVTEVFEGACLVFAGALLLTPGFLTDGIGFFLMIPPLRRMVIAAVVSRATVRMHTQHGHAQWNGPRNDGRHGPGPIIDGDFETVDPNTTEPTNRGSSDEPDQRPPSLT